MTHGQDFVEELPNKEAHSRCLQTALLEEAKRPAKKSCFGVKSSQGI